MEKQGRLSEFIFNFAFIYKQLKISVIYCPPERAPGSLLFSARGAKEQNAEQKTCNVPRFVPQFENI